LALARGRDILAAGVELLDRLFAGLDRLGEPDFVVLRQKRVLPDIGEVQADEVLVVTVDAIFGHSGSFGPRWNPTGSRHDTDLLHPGNPAVGGPERLALFCIRAAKRSVRAMGAEPAGDADTA